MSEVHLHAWLFFNPCGKVLIIVGILWSPDLRVQHIYIDIYIFIFIFPIILDNYKENFTSLNKCSFS